MHTKLKHENKRKHARGGTVSLVCGIAETCPVAYDDFNYMCECNLKHLFTNIAINLKEEISLTCDF